MISLLLYSTLLVLCFSLLSNGRVLPDFAKANDILPRRVTSEFKHRQLSELSHKEGSRHIVNLDDGTYEYFCVSKPRSYSVIVFLTAAHPTFKCAVCKQMDYDFQRLAAAYIVDIKEKSLNQSIFFVRVDYEYSPQVFKNYDLFTVPYLFHIPPYLAEKEAKDWEILPKDKLQIVIEPQIELALKFFRDRTGIPLEIKVNSFWSYVVIVVIFSLLVYAIEPIINALPTLQAMLQEKQLWIAVSLGVYTCAISGLIFDIIRAPPIYESNPQTGEIQLFYPQSGSQFVVEGFIIGALNLVCASSLIFAAAIAPNFKNAQTKSTCVTLALITFISCFMWVRYLYRMKNKWYVGY